MLTERQKKEINRAEVEQFIRFLTGSLNSQIHWQWFDDQKRGRVVPGNSYGSISEKWNELVSLNEEGAGIFVTINQTDGIKRKA